MQFALVSLLLGVAIAFGCPWLHVTHSPFLHPYWVSFSISTFLQLSAYCTLLSIALFTWPASLDCRLHYPCRPMDLMTNDS
ncbi:hypothetical protein BDV30DRAFT_152725 [Aspergillus minisclerotigenes]|uniref:MARVEL domain-containing protein n=1 Tax=Aspergillus minisclerotigenes TaxID=656917 RepID=A0A5N6IY97_9EURO|nr:hypothetical protein BDV30DRAFT_152725 [Aspergillus minisclerotigenes]